MHNTLTDILQNAKENKVAIAAFNIFNYQTAKAILDAAQALNTPVILQTSTKTVTQFGAAQLGKMLIQLREFYSIPVAIHLDHCRDAGLAKECVDNGWDGVMMDYSQKLIEENIRLTKQMVEYAHSRGCAVEGEVGVISGVEDDIFSQDEKETDFKEVQYYIKQTGVDAIAPAIGTAHGEYTAYPKLNFELLKKVSALNCFSVLHGGTGLMDADFKKIVSSGAVKVNLSFIVKKTWLDAVAGYLSHGGRDPLTMDRNAQNAVRKMAAEKMKLFCERK